MRTALIFLLVLPTFCFAATWKTTTTRDRPTDSSVVAYEALSDNTFSFAFPYQGATKARLLVRDKGQKEQDVIFVIERGQLVHDVRDGEIRVRFDDGEIDTFSTSRAASRDSHIAFIGSEERFIEKASKAKRIRVEFTVFSNGTHVADFRFTKTLPMASSSKRPDTVSPPLGLESLNAKPVLGKVERLAVREDECRTKRELVECLEMVRACYGKAQSADDETDCQERVERFPR